MRKRGSDPPLPLLIDNWYSRYSTVLAGGEIHGGPIYRASDAHAAYVKESPVRP